MVSRYAVVVDGLVANVVLWDASAAWEPPQNAVLVQLTKSQAVDVGNSYDGKSFTSQPPEPNPLAQAEAVVAAQADPDQPNPSVPDLLQALAVLASQS
jgi:hypothetical protein